MQTIKFAEITNFSTALDYHTKAVENTLLHWKNEIDDVYKTLTILRQGREYEIIHFSKRNNPKLILDICKYRKNSSAMALVIEEFNMDCAQKVFEFLNESNISKERKDQLLSVFMKHFLSTNNMALDEKTNFQVSNFVLQSKQQVLEKLLKSEDSMQQKYNCLLSEIAILNVQYENEIEKIEREELH